MAWDEDIDDIARNSKGITPRVFLYALPILRQARGYLERNGQPVTSADLARMINVPQGDVGKSLRELHTTLKVFGRSEDGVYFYPKMAAFFRKNAKTSENLNDESSQGGKFHEGGSQNQTSQSKVEDSKADAFVGTSSTTKAASAADATSTGQKESPGAGPGPFSAPTSADVAEVLGSRQLDANVTPEWIANRIVHYGVDLSCLRKVLGFIDGRVTRVAINGLFKREHKPSASTAAAQPTRDSVASAVEKAADKPAKKKPSKEKFDVWKAGRLYRKLTEGGLDFESILNRLHDEFGIEALRKFNDVKQVGETGQLIVLKED